MRKTEKFFFSSSFFFLFVSFLPFFLIFLSFFLFRSRKWGRNGVRMDSDSFPFEFLFMEKNQGINWKNLKEVLPIFRSFFLDFFFLKTLLPFSFGERKWKIGTIKMCAPIALKRFCKNTTFVLATLIYPVQGKNLYPRHEIFWIAKLKRPYFVERRNEVFFASEMTLKVRISSLFLPF